MLVGSKGLSGSLCICLHTQKHLKIVPKIPEGMCWNWHCCWIAASEAAVCQTNLLHLHAGQTQALYNMRLGSDRQQATLCKAAC